MNKRRILSIILTITLLISTVSMLSGCGEKGGKAKEDPAVTGAVDLGGKTIKILTWGNGLAGITVDPSTDTELGEIRAERFEEMEKLYNCTFEYELMSAGEIPSKYTTAAMAGEKIADLICLRNSSLPALLNNELLLPLDDYFDFSKSQFSQLAVELSTLDGKVYAFSVENTNHVENVLYFNKRIFDDVGLEYPYQLVKDKKWTTEVFEEYLKKATVLNNDGTVAINGMYGFSYNGDNLPNFISCFGAEFAKKKGDGSFVSGLNDPEMTTALEFVRRNMFDNKYIYNVSGNADWTEGSTMFKEGKVAMIMSQVTYNGGGYSDMTDPVGILPLPLGPGQKDYAVSEMYENVMIMPTTTDSKTAQAIANMITYIYAPAYEDEAENAELLKSNIADTFSDEESVEIAYDLITKSGMKVYNHRIVGDETIVRTAMNDSIHGVTTVASAIGSAASAWEIVIDNYNSRYGLGDYAKKD